MSAGSSIKEITQTLGKEDAERVRRVLDGGVKIPAQPRVLEALRKLMARQELDVRPLARTINQDPGLTAMLFKVVGNAAYRKHQPFDSVEQILHAVGVQQTYHLVQAIALSSAVGLRKNHRVYEAFWARSQAVGELAMLIADERIAVCNLFPDQAYLTGIFHACGVPLLLQRFPSYCHELRLGTPGRWTDWREEDRKFNTDHAVVGYLVARHWCLPGFICDAIRHQHAVAELGDHESRSMVAILLLAIDIHAREQRVPNPEWDEVKAVVLPELGLSDEALPEFVDIILERFGCAAGL
ncbi:histidine kinase [Azonexus hydrophilus]|uniref:Histidine kinase n=1 Tax=Azonexus hydrophilus TaxID=418702 RepID=A0A1R1I099_9RHOO|nr:HDOD domain-containing protein [Azonexus hydrophilus]OMG52141.1 histidine kinase [Azonexus hydrophilus]